MTVVATWTGRHACSLQSALRLTNDSFAAKLGTAVRTVAKWHGDPGIVPTVEVQQALDVMLEQASQAETERFCLLLDQDLSSQGDPDDRVDLRTTFDLTTVQLLNMIDRAAGWPIGDAEKQIATVTEKRLGKVDAATYSRQAVSREEISSALQQYYSPVDSAQCLYAVEVDGTHTATSILTKRSWTELDMPLVQGLDNLALKATAPHDDELHLTPTQANAAIERVSYALATNTQIVNAPLYRLMNLDVDRTNGISGNLNITNFANYALTLDLLEGELLDAISSHRPIAPGHLPLRDGYLADIHEVLNPHSRLCVGGSLALFAAARPCDKRTGRGEDYALLVQQRSGRVLNASQRLAVIPKAFHGPLGDFSDDAHIRATLEREMEEELFARYDVDTTLNGMRSADPLHISRLSAPMRWLMEHTSSWHLECTAFGFNLVSGNFEFACLIVINNEEWWQQYSGHIEANWESANLTRYSSLDRELLAQLATDPRWANEGVFAFTQGIKRLQAIDKYRVNAPTIQQER